MTHNRVRPEYFHTFISIIVCNGVFVWELAAKMRVIFHHPLSSHYFASFALTEVCTTEFEQNFQYENILIVSVYILYINARVYSDAQRFLSWSWEGLKALWECRQSGLYSAYQDHQKSTETLVNAKGKDCVTVRNYFAD